MTFLSTLDEQLETPAPAGPATRRYAAWRRTAATVALPYRIAILFMAGSLASSGTGWSAWSSALPL